MIVEVISHNSYSTMTKQFKLDNLAGVTALVNFVEGRAKDPGYMHVREISENKTWL